MVGSLCGFRRRPNKSLKQDYYYSDQNKRSHGPTMIMKFAKPRSLWEAMKVEKVHFLPQETQANQLQKIHNNGDEQALTLEDWIMSSPGFNKTNYSDIINISSMGGEQLNAHKQSSRKIHPSFDGDDLMIKQDQLLPDEEGGINTRLFSRTKSGKMKKKVSFRSPEVADIFVLDNICY